MTTAVLVHGCEALVQDALLTALEDLDVVAWEPGLPACTPGTDRVLLLAAPVHEPCRAGCSRCLTHWRSRHRDLPVVLLGAEDPRDDWLLGWDDDLDRLRGCLDLAAAGVRPR